MSREPSTGVPSVRCHTGVPSLASKAKTWFAIVASSTKSRVRPPGNRAPAKINGCASAPRRSPGNGKENSRLMPRLRTAAAVSTLSSRFAPSRVLL